MSLERNIGWLAGVVDGEGSLSLSPRYDRRVTDAGRQSLYVRAALEIENTSEALVQKVRTVLNSLGVANGHICKTFMPTKRFQATDGTVHSGDKGYHRVTVSARKPLRTLLYVLLPELTVKVAAAHLLLSFLDRTVDYTSYRPTLVDLELCQQLRELQGRREKPFPMDQWVSRLRTVDGEPIPCQAEGSMQYRTSEGVEARP